jgi:hypothetical protein
MVSAARRSPANITPVKFCFHCGRNTVGEPLFCNYCGRSYDVKLCPKLHANPRRTRACSKCGSAELSTPQPRVPFWAKIVLLLLTIIPGLIVGAISVGLVGFFLERFLLASDMLLGLVVNGSVLTMLWWARTEVRLHSWRAIHRWLQKQAK